MQKVLVASLLAIFTLLTSHAWATCHVITPAGSGNQSGSDWNNACAAFSGSCSSSNMVRGDSYYVAKGSYSSPSLTKSNSGSTPITLKSPTSADHCTDAGFSSSVHVGQAVWNGSVFISSDYWNIDGQYGTEIPGTGKGTYGLKVVNSDTSSTVFIFNCNGGCSNSTFRYIEIKGSNAGTGCTAYDTGWYLNPSAAGGKSAALIEHSYVYQTNMFLKVNTWSNLTIRNNIMAENYSGSNCHGEYLGIIGINGLTVANNRFINCVGTACVAFGTCSAPCAADSNMSFYGNLFYNDNSRSGSCPNNFSCIGNGILADIDQTPINGLKLYNNTVANWTSATTGASELEFYSTASGGANSGIESRNNLFYNNIPTNASYGTCASNSYYSTSRYGTACSGDQETTGDPFVNSNTDFHLVSDTSAWTSLAAPYNVDPDGVTRSSSRGAYQLASNTPTPTPPSGLQAIVQ